MSPAISCDTFRHHGMYSTISCDTFRLHGMYFLISFDTFRHLGMYFLISFDTFRRNGRYLLIPNDTFWRSELQFFVYRGIFPRFLLVISLKNSIFALEKIDSLMLPIHFAPLQGFTEAPYRRIHQQVCGGVEAYYTPFIRLEHGQIRKKDLREALPEQNEGVHIIPQVIAGNAEEFCILAEKLIDLGHQEIDINMGCPFPLQTRLGRGSGILPHADKVTEILLQASALHESKGVSFSVKMRLGQESPEECLALLPVLNQTPLKHVTMHPRIGRSQYKGELDMQSFECFYEQCQLPIVFNGVLTTVEEMQRVEQQYPKLAGLMIGRGLLSRPTLAAEYQSGNVLTDAEVRKRILEMHKLLMAHYSEAIDGGEAQLAQKMQSFWEYQEPLFGHKVVKKILKAGNLKNYKEAVSLALSLR